MAKNDGGETGDVKNIDDLAREQAGRQTRVGLDERNVKTSYANLFLTSATPEEVIVTFGLNMANPGAQGQQNQPEVIFQLSDRVVMNYYLAKRLAIALGQIVRTHESQFGELELDIAKRRKDQPK
jgi:hypothetical protein